MKQAYQQMTGCDLGKDIKSDCGGKYEYAMLEFWGY